MKVARRVFTGNNMIYASDLQDMSNAISNALDPLLIGKRGAKLRIIGANLLPDTTYTLQLIRRSRRANKVGTWVDVDSKDGYYGLVEHAKFASPPEWLPPLVYQFQVKTDEEGKFMYNIVASQLFFPFIKPLHSDSKALPENPDPNFRLTFVGLNRKRPYRQLHFSFNLLLNGEIVKTSNNIIMVNGVVDDKPERSMHVSEQGALKNIRVKIL